MKSASIVLGTVLLLFTLSMSALADYTYPVVVLDGRSLPIEMPAIDEKGRTMVPVRAFFEELGAVVDWDEGKQLITISKAETEIKLTLDQTTALINGQPVELETTPVNAGGRILVPLRFVAEAIGAQVSWNAETQEINIQTTADRETGNRSPGASAPTAPTGPASPSAPINEHLGDWEPPSAERQLLIKGLGLLLALVTLLIAVKFYRRWRRDLEEDEIEPFNIVDLVKSDAAAEMEESLAGLDLTESGENSGALSGMVSSEEEVITGSLDLDKSPEGEQIANVVTVDEIAVNKQQETVPGEAATAEDDQITEFTQMNEYVSTSQPDMAAPDEQDQTQDQSLAKGPAAIPADQPGPAEDKPAVGLQDEYGSAEVSGVESTEVEKPREAPTAAMISQTDEAADRGLQVDPVEANYQEGLRQIQREDWAQARLALVYPSVLKYRDAEDLTYFVEAVEQYQESMRPEAADPYWAALMADYYCRKIPDGYDGSFQLQVQQLKQMCSDRYAELAQDPGAVEKHEMAERQRKLREES